MKELGRVEIHLHETAGSKEQGAWRGVQVVGDRLTALPVGSTLDSDKGIFYWQPGLAFLGEYKLVFFTREKNGKLFKKHITIKIGPR